LPGGVLISALVHEAQLEHSGYQWAFSEPPNGNHQQLQFVAHSIQKVPRNVPHNGHQLWETMHSVLRLFGQSKQPSRQWLYKSLLLKSGWTHGVPHGTACIQGTYVGRSSKAIQSSRGTYLHWVELKRLVVEWTGTLVQFGSSYDGCDCLHSYSGHLGLRLYLYSTVQTRHILNTIWATRRNCQYIGILETPPWRLDQILWILHASLLPLFLFFQNLTS